MNYTDNPVNDAMDYFEEIEKLAKDNAIFYPCNSCCDSLEEWTGGLKVAGENEYYCPECIGKSRHIAKIRDYCETTKQANQIIESLEGC